MSAKFSLKDGLNLGDEVQLDVELRLPGAGDFIEASQESEQLVAMPIGLDKGGNALTEPQLVVSPTLMGIHTLRRQIVCIGSIPGPIELVDLKRLSDRDLHLIQQKAEELDKASFEVAQRGRTDTQGEGHTDGS